MTLALRVTFETEGRLILFGDSFQVTANGPVSFTRISGKEEVQYWVIVEHKSRILTRKDSSLRAQNDTE